MKVTNENIEWARSEKRVFLRQSLEIKLIGQYVHYAFIINWSSLIDISILSSTELH